VSDPTETFEAERSLLLGLAYRLLGSMWDAEDVVQEAYLRWLRTDHEEVRDPRAFLIRVTTRLALDHLRSARVRRETYPGPWLPEPVATEALGPLDTVELRDSVSIATLHLLERLTPPERAVLVLRDAFELDYDQVADVVEREVATCRQLHHRGRERLAADRTRFSADPDEHARLLEAFLTAAATGDLDGLRSILHDDVTAWSDGGGKVRAALRPVIGADKVASMLIGLTRQSPIRDVQIIDVNGRLGAMLISDAHPIFLTLQVVDGRIAALYGVGNPDKLTRLRAGAVPAPPPGGASAE
jgi:RNA polymerase sigma-70 factor, ECF subfamily